MVADVQTPGLDEAALDTDLESGLEFDAESSPEADDDPVAALRAELAATNARLDGALRALNPEQINRALGHIPALQRDLDAIRKSGDPRAAIEAAITEYDGAIAAMAAGMLASDFVDDGSKGPIRQAMQRLAANNDERKTARLERDLLAKMQAANGPEQVAPPDPQSQWQAALANATQRLIDFADGKDVPWETVPESAKGFTSDEAELAKTDPNRALQNAMTRVRKVITDLASESAATERTAQRRRAAGAGSPASAGINGYSSQRAVDQAHMDGRLTSAQVQQLRSSGRYAALPY